MAEYSASSPWFKTPQNSNYLELHVYREIPINKDDYPYEIEAKFNFRPDLLAHSLYNDSGLWWVFSQRNPSIIKDPVFDFEAGVVIYVPRADTLKASLGI